MSIYTVNSGSKLFTWRVYVHGIACMRVVGYDAHLFKKFLLGGKLWSKYCIKMDDYTTTATKVWCHLVQ